VQIDFTFEPFEYWSFFFAPPRDSEVDLAPGVYENAIRYPGNEDTTVPSMDASGDYRGCRTGTGRFEVIEVVFGVSEFMTTTVESFAAEFDYTCAEGLFPRQWFRGQIRFNSSVPLRPTFTHTETATPTPTPTQTPKPTGRSCIEPEECASGFCADGVCCDRACDSAGEVCNVSGSVGRCLTVPLTRTRTATALATPTGTPTATRTTTPPATATPLPPAIAGDGNCDTLVTAADLSALVLDLAGDGFAVCGSDANRSGSVEADDVGALIGMLFATGTGLGRSAASPRDWSAIADP
jgi:hypothetical protein